MGISKTCSYPTFAMGIYGEEEEAAAAVRYVQAIHVFLRLMYVIPLDHHIHGMG